MSVCAGPTSPSLDAIIDSEHDIPNLVDVNDGEELTLEQIKSLFGDNIIKPTLFADGHFTDVQPANTHFVTPIPSPSSTPSPHSSPPCNAASEFDSTLHEGVSSVSSKCHRSSAKAANRARKDRKKHKKTADRRSNGQLLVHGEAYINRHMQSQFLSRDFSVLDYSAVSGGDTGKVGGLKKKKSPKVSMLKGAAQGGYSLYLWDGWCVFSDICFSLC